MSLEANIPRVVDIPDSFPYGGEWYVRVNRRASAWLAARNAGRNLRLEPSTLVTREMTDEEREARRQRLAERNGPQAKRPAVYPMRRSSAEAYRPKPEVQQSQPAPSRRRTACRRRPGAMASKPVARRAPAFAMENLDRIIAAWLGVA